MKVSNCCGENGNVSHHISFIVDDWITYEQQELCPKCGEHCEYIEETDLNTINTENEQRTDAANRDNLSTCDSRKRV